MSQITIRLLDDVQNVNSMEIATEVSGTAGEMMTVYIQLVNTTRQTCDTDSPVVRYMPAVGATLNVTFDNIDAAKRVTKVASQPFANDGSVWQVDLTAQDTAKVRGTVSLVFTLTEGARAITGRLLAAILVMA